MSKTPETLSLESAAIKNLCKHGIFGCIEVTIGWYGKERVDFMTIDTKDTVRCYEIKVSKVDFYSKAARSFVGHLNYYIMPHDLYNEVANDVPDDIGVLVTGKSELTSWICLNSIKKAKRRTLGVDMDVIKMSMIRSLCRDAQKHYAKAYEGGHGPGNQKMEAEK